MNQSLPTSPHPGPLEESTNYEDPVITPEEKGEKRFRNSRIISFFLAIFFLVLVAIAVVWARQVPSEQKQALQTDSVRDSFVRETEPSLLPSASPDPFAELTIPYLRQRQYQSSLSQLEQLAVRSNYTSYLTSFESDGLKVNGLLTIPEGDQTERWPAIVFVHGYIPPASYSTTDNYEAYVDYLARNGYVVFKIDLRGHGQSEGEASGAYYSGDYIIDVLNARAALQQADFVAPDKIGLWGHSMAGNVIMRSLAAQPDIPAIAIWAGAVYTYEDFQDNGIQDSSYQRPSPDSQRARERDQLFELHGSFDPTDEFWMQVPATNYLDEINGAVGIFHAVNDEVVDIEYSRNFDQILSQTQIQHQLNEYSSGGHNISGSSFNQAMSDTVQFFDQYLKE